jgi:hypothetical protein
VFAGSRNDAASSDTPSGTRVTPPPATIHGITRTYSANPPPAGSKPAVTPVFL